MESEQEKTTKRRRKNERRGGRDIMPLSDVTLPNLAPQQTQRLPSGMLVIIPFKKILSNSQIAPVLDIYY